MKDVPDRKSRRREYLRKKVRGYRSVAAWYLVTLITAIVVLSIAYLTLTHRLDMVSATVSIAFWGTMCMMSWRSLRESHEQVKKISYAPPVTANTLPADEILLRGSEEPPVAQSEVLLRATQSQETPSKELLRVMDDQYG